MRNIILNFIIKDFLITSLKVVLLFYSFGIILNLFEEIEFFKNLNTSFYLPLILTGMYIPSTIIQLMPFIIFISSIWFLVKIRNNKELLILKTFGYSNFKLFLILATTAFLLGWMILILLSPITSNMVKYYEKTKSIYAEDIDHLITFNKNGLWIKENTIDGTRIVSAKNAEKNIIKDILIFNFDNNYVLKNKVKAKSANISKNTWVLNDISILSIENQSSNENKMEQTTFDSIYTYEKIINLYKNFDTISFIDLTLNYDEFLDKGYNENFLNQNLQSMLSLPFFLMIMTALASTLTLNTMKKSNNFKFIIIGLILVIVIFYLKDLSLALGQTDRIPLALANWVPVIAVGIFSFIGILQINEK